MLRVWFVSGQDINLCLGCGLFRGRTLICARSVVCFGAEGFICARSVLYFGADGFICAWSVPYFRAGPPVLGVWFVLGQDVNLCWYSLFPGRTLICARSVVCFGAGLFICARSVVCFGTGH